MLNWSEIPQKKVVKQPIYDTDRSCKRCGSKNTYPVMNMTGSPLQCMSCNIHFDQKIIGYRDIIVEE
jgi:hypothetical protein